MKYDTLPLFLFYSNPAQFQVMERAGTFLCEKSKKVGAP